MLKRWQVIQVFENLFIFFSCLFTIFLKNYHPSNAFWLYQHRVKNAPIKFYSHLLLTIFNRNTLHFLVYPNWRLWKWWFRIESLYVHKYIKPNKYPANAGQTPNECLNNQYHMSRSLPPNPLRLEQKFVASSSSSTVWKK